MKDTNSSRECLKKERPQKHFTQNSRGWNSSQFVNIKDEKRDPTKYSDF